MRRQLGTLGLAAALALVFGATASAVGRDNFGPYASNSPDSGTCGNNWAQDTFKRSFEIRNNGDGTFLVREDFDGTFVTVAGPSPGACQTTGSHGLLVPAGIRGTFFGYLQGTVTSATYNPNATCPPDPVFGCTATGFLTAAFGPAGPATFSCFTGVGDCPFSFKYSARGQGLSFHFWKNASPDNGGNSGDIAS